MFINRDILEAMRRTVIQFLNLLDDALGLPRTLLPKDERRKLRQLDKQ